MADLTYIPTAPPTKLFAVGDRVEVLDRSHAVIGWIVIAHVGPKGVRTDDGRLWTTGGLWRVGRRSYPFPLIRHAKDSQ